MADGTYPPNGAGASSAESAEEKEALTTGSLEMPVGARRLDSDRPGTILTLNGDLGVPNAMRFANCARKHAGTIGSQSMLGQFANAPMRLLVSMEADVYRNHNPVLADRVDGAISEGSAFHALNGYDAQGIGPETAELPSGRPLWAIGSTSSQYKLNVRFQA